MNEDLVLTMGAEAVKVTLYIAGPMLIAAMVIGIIISIMQAVTQINEATLTFIPKMLAVVVVLAVLAPWMLQLLRDYATEVLGNVGMWVR